MTYLVERGYTLDPQDTTFEAITVAGGRVTWLGSAREARRCAPARTIHRLDGAFMVPGLVDSHLHLGLMGRAEDAVDLSHVRGIDELVAAVRARESDAWIEGVGWDDAQWPVPLSPEALHAALPAVPIVLHRRDHHAAWVSRPLLAAAGIDGRSADPPGGRVDRDVEGQPNGLLLDAAIEPVHRALPQPSPAQRARWLVCAVTRCRAAGLTAVHEICTPAGDVGALRALDETDRLPVRVDAFLDSEDDAFAPLFEAGPVAGRRFCVVGVKLFCDGALGSRGAWLSSPYSDDPDTTGLRIIHGHPLRNRVRCYGERGFHVAVHGIGDGAAADIIAAFTEARARGVRSRLRLEHAQIVDPESLARVGGLDLVCAVQPVHAIDDGAWYLRRLGPGRAEWAYRLRSLADAGARVVLGTDAPISALDPMATLRAATTTRRPRGADEALSVAHALRAHSVDAAYAVGGPSGGLAPGHRADFTLLDGDPLDGDPLDDGPLDAIQCVGSAVDGALSSAPS